MLHEVVGIMQTFLPVADFKASAKILDYKRLGKQRVEGMQLLNAMQPDYDKKGWLNHPATVMWTGYENALKEYVNTMIIDGKCLPPIELEQDGRKTYE